MDPFFTGTRADEVRHEGDDDGGVRHGPSHRHVAAQQRHRHRAPPPAPPPRRQRRDRGPSRRHPARERGRCGRRDVRRVRQDRSIPEVPIRHHRQPPRQSLPRDLVPRHPGRGEHSIHARATIRRRDHPAQVQQKRGAGGERTHEARVLPLHDHARHESLRRTSTRSRHQQGYQAQARTRTSTIRRRRITPHGHPRRRLPRRQSHLLPR